MTNDDGVPLKCLFCRMPVTQGFHAYWEHDGLELPCHHTCKAVLDIANKNFWTFPDQSWLGYKPKQGRVIGLASVSFDDTNIPWHRFTDEIKEKRYVKCLAVLQAMLDRQEAMIRSYCERNQLGTPHMVREWKPSAKLLKQLNFICADAKPGDHIVIVNLPAKLAPKGQGKHLNHYFHFTRQKGVTLHSARFNLDFSKPLPQYIATMGEWLEDKEVPFYTYNAGKLKNLFGLDWYASQRNNAFMWFIRCIRDGHMSPTEVGKFSKTYHCLVVYSMRKDMFATLVISRNRELIDSFAKLPISYCLSCYRFAYTPVCFRCLRPSPPAKKVVVVGGVEINPEGRSKSRLKRTPAEVAAACWAFYCDNTPEQDKQPWLKRKNLVA